MTQFFTFLIILFDFRENGNQFCRVCQTDWAWSDQTSHDFEMFFYFLKIYKYQRPIFDLQIQIWEPKAPSEWNKTTKNIFNEKIKVKKKLFKIFNIFKTNLLISGSSSARVKLVSNQVGDRIFYFLDEQLK